MRKSRFTEDQIAFALKQAELGIGVEEVCRKMGISDATFYVWRKKYSGVGPSELRRLRQLEQENRQLKQIVADLSLDKAMLQAVVTKKSEPLGSPGAGAGVDAALRVQPAQRAAGLRHVVLDVLVRKEAKGRRSAEAAHQGDHRHPGARDAKRSFA